MDKPLLEDPPRERFRPEDWGASVAKAPARGVGRTRFFQIVQGLLLFWGMLLAGYLYGGLSVKYDWFPAPQFSEALRTGREIADQLRGTIKFPYFRTDEKRTVIVHQPAAIAPGLRLVNGIGPKGSMFARLVDADGKTLHAWDLDWFRLWPNPDHVPPEDRPHQRPGTDIHGIAIAPNGDLTFNFEHLGLMQVDICGRPKWRLAKLTNHDVFVDEDGNYWTLYADKLKKPLPGLPHIKPPIDYPYVLKLSPDGRVLKRIALFEVLQRNGMTGMLHFGMGSDPRVSDEVLHENNVDVFPRSMAPGLFKPGDIMVSTRNNNTVMVFDQDTLKIVGIVTGRWTRQHDPDFVDGSTITVFDNNNLGRPPDKASSRILQYSFKDGSEKVLFEGNSEHPFYTRIMGKQHRLENGNRLISEPLKGRIFEIDPSGKLVWEYFNHVEPGVLGLLSEGQNIPPSFMSVSRLEELKAQCSAR